MLRGRRERWEWGWGCEGGGCRCRRSRTRGRGKRRGCEWGENRGPKGEGEGLGESSRQQIGIRERMGEGQVKGEGRLLVLVAGEVLLLLGGC